MTKHISSSDSKDKLKALMTADGISVDALLQWAERVKLVDATITKQRAIESMHDWAIEKLLRSWSSVKHFAKKEKTISNS